MNIVHPSMKKATGSATSTKIQQETFVVDDAMQIDEHLQQFGQAERPLMPSDEVLNKAKEIPKPPKDLKKEAEFKKLENILFLGRLTKIIELADSKFEVSTLTNKEQNDIVRELYTFSEGADLFIIRTLTLGHALKTINGIKLDDMDLFTEEEEQLFSSKYKRRMAIIDHMQLFVIEKIYEEYNNLLKENESLLAKDTIKK